MTASGLDQNEGYVLPYNRGLLPDLEGIYFPKDNDFGSIPWSSGTRRLVAEYALTKDVDVTDANQSLMSRLVWGAERLVIDIATDADVDWAVLFHEIDLSMISLELRGVYDVLSFEQYVQEVYDGQVVRVFHEKDLRIIDIERHSDIKVVMQHIAAGLVDLVRQEERLSWPSTLIVLPDYDDFLLLIAMVRATQMLVHGLKDAGFASGEDYPAIRLHVTAQLEDEGLETLIGRSAKALAGALAGVDQVLFDPQIKTALDLTDDDKVRLTQHLHWLIAYESGLQSVEDRLHGSQFIEAATAQLFDVAWDSCATALGITRA